MLIKLLAHIHGLSPILEHGLNMKMNDLKFCEQKISHSKWKSRYVLDENLTVACKSNSIQILEIQRQGKNKQTTKDFLLGKKISKGFNFN